MPAFFLAVRIESLFVHRRAHHAVGLSTHLQPLVSYTLVVHDILHPVENRLIGRASQIDRTHLT